MRLGLFLVSTAFAATVNVGQLAPDFSLHTQEGTKFELSSRIGKGWTVLFFYPKAGTPGCTKQVCAFRDSVKKIREQGAEIYGISADSVEAQAKFHKEHKLLFTLLADPTVSAIKSYGVKAMGIDLAKRWTFILDPQLVVRAVDTNVDPAMDAAKVAETLKSLQSQQPNG